MVAQMDYIDEEDLWEFLKTKNWAFSTMKTRAQAICQANRENLTEDDIYEKYVSRKPVTRTKLRLGVRLLKEFKEWDKNVDKNR